MTRFVRNVKFNDGSPIPDELCRANEFADQNGNAMRRVTRLTSAHSKKIENHEHALAIYFIYYNFARIHSTLRVTPAMEAGVSNHVWNLEKIISFLDS